MVGRATATPRRGSTSFWRGLKRGPWPPEVVERLVHALDALVHRLRGDAEVVGVVLFGSYARGEFGRKSDVDLLILFEGEEPPERAEIGRAALRTCGEIETEYRLPMHLAPLLASVDRASDLGPDLLHAIWTDGLILYADASALARLQPPGLAPWVAIRFTTVRLSPSERVRLSRLLHGFGSRPGLVQPPGLVLGKGALLVPGAQQKGLRDALDTVGASYDLFPLWG